MTDPHFPGELDTLSWFDHLLDSQRCPCCGLRVSTCKLIQFYIDRELNR